jgi:hypothetical protein
LKNLSTRLLVFCALAWALSLRSTTHLAGREPGENLIVNGGFEVPALTGRGLIEGAENGFFGTGTPGLGWTVVTVIPGGGDSRLEFQRSGREWAARDGSQYAELDGFHPLRIFQDIQTIPGRIYALKYSWSPRPGPYENQLQVCWDGMTLATHGASYSKMAPLLHTSWRDELFLVTASNKTTRLEFVETGKDDGRGMFLDAVSIVDWGNKVNISIQPGTSTANAVHCRDENELIAVAILSSDDFDARAVDHASVRFQGAPEFHRDSQLKPVRHEQDVNGDGRGDLLLHFRMGDTNLRCDWRDGSVLGKTYNGGLIKGTASLTMTSK